MHPLSFVLGVAVGGLAGVFGTRTYYRRHPLALQGGGAGNAHLAGKIVGYTVGNPAPQSLPPQAGYQSRADYEWMYIVGPGDSAASIAEAITGDDGRYQELILVNPDVPQIGTPGLFMGDAWDFAKLVDSERLYLPLPWSRFIDELGNARGMREPFPIDPRAKSERVQMAADPAPLPLASAAGRRGRLMVAEAA